MSVSRTNTGTHAIAADASQRKVKGTNLLDLVKGIRAARRLRELPPLPPAAEALLAQRIIASEWYPHHDFVVLLNFMYTQLLGAREAKAYEVGTASARVQLSGPLKVMVAQDDPLGSVFAMRHVWRLSFNFGELRAQADGDGTVKFALSGYADVGKMHAYTIAGWGAAAAQVSGAPRATGTVISFPSAADPILRYQIDLRLRSESSWAGPSGNTPPAR